MSHPEFTNSIKHLQNHELNESSKYHELNHLNLSHYT